MKTLWIKLTEEQEKHLRQAVGMEENVQCKHIAIKLSDEALADITRGQDGGMVLLYNGPPPHGYEEKLVALA